MKKTIYYATGNNAKFEQVKHFVEKENPNLTIKQFIEDIPEIQTTDQKTIAISKALQAWKKLQKPLLVDDSGLYFTQYNNFPGALTKFVYQGIGYKGILKLVENDNRAFFLVCMVYIFDKNKFEIFEGKVDGVIKPPVDEPPHPQLPMNNIFYPEGGDTSYAKYYIENEPGLVKDNARIKAARKFLAWFSKQ
ncbi:MAG: non-canonical purine NTP pyrophosphatase [bacterium]